MAKKVFEDIEFHGQVDIKQDVNIDKPISGIKRYVAKIVQSSTDDPVATIFENSLDGVPVWTRASAGNYSCTLAGAFLNNKVISMVAQDLWATGNSGNGYREVITRGSDNYLTLKQINNTLTPADGFTMYVDVTVYP